MRKLVAYARAVCFALLAVSVAYFLAMKQGWLRPRPTAVAWSVVVLCAWLAVELAAAVALAALRKLGPLAAAARICLALGGLLLLGGGLANWAYSLRGFVLMAEGEAAPFFHGTHLQQFAAGPLSNVREMELVLHLDEIELVPDETGELIPVSKLRLEREGEAPHRFALTPTGSVADGTLRFYQGLFGYAPRIVILHEGAELFDKVVPFTTRHDEGGRVVFAGEFTVEKFGLHVTGEVLLDSLDPQLRGHPMLALSVTRNDVPLGAGTLRMGHFADLPQDHRVGFAGLKKWAEIDIIRKHYAGPMQAGAGLIGLGILLIAVSWAVRRRRRQ